MQYRIKIQISKNLLVSSDCKMLDINQILLSIFLVE